MRVLAFLFGVVLVPLVLTPNASATCTLDGQTVSQGTASASVGTTTCQEETSSTSSASWFTGVRVDETTTRTALSIGERESESTSRGYGTTTCTSESSGADANAGSLAASAGPGESTCSTNYPYGTSNSTMQARRAFLRDGFTGTYVEARDWQSSANESSSWYWYTSESTGRSLSAGNPEGNAVPSLGFAVYEYSSASTYGGSAGCVTYVQGGPAYQRFGNVIPGQTNCALVNAAFALLP